MRVNAAVKWSTTVAVIGAQAATNFLSRRNM
jgi:hypothetical protein